MSTIHTLRRNRLKRAGTGTTPDAANDLHAELVLLREENQRLRTADGGAPDLEALIERVRQTPERTVEDPLDEAAELLAESLMIRETVVEICRTLRRTSTELEARLLRTGADA